MKQAYIFDLGLVIYTTLRTLHIKYTIIIPTE